MKIVKVSAIATGVVILFGIILIIPTFMRTGPTQVVLLSFSINDDQNMPTWCHDLSTILEKQNVKAVVFITGKIAERYPQCVTSFPNNVDIGSQTYDYVPLPSIPDYSAQLDEIKNGKIAVDKAGNLDSRVFRAPDGLVDQNIYSLLEKSNILADFSYDKQYNEYYKGQFIKLDLTAYKGISHSAAFFRNISTKDPILISFDNSVPTKDIDSLILELKSGNLRFVNTSDLTPDDLTIRKETKS